MIKHLRELAHDGRTVICVIHQPSSSLFQLFDDVYLLSNGYCIYNGSLVDMVDAFKQAGFNCPTSYYNRADYALEVASRQRGDNIDQLIDLARSKGIGGVMLPEIVSNGGTNMDLVPLNDDPYTLIYTEISQPLAEQTGAAFEKMDYPVSTWRQIQVLTKRSMICTLRDFVS